MNILRKIKINSLGYYKYNNSEKKLLYFIKENMLNLKIVELKNYPDYIMYFNDKGENIFQQDLKTPWFGVNYDLIWGIIEKKFNYNYYQTRDLIKDVIEQAYKLNEVRLLTGFFTPILEVEQAYKHSMNNNTKI